MTTAVTSSYIETIEDFETRLTGDLRAAAIALLAAESAVQTWYLQRATRSIDQLPFIGYKVESSQVLQHPRKFVLNPEQDSPWGITLSIDAYGYYYESAVNEVIKVACVEEALALYSSFTSTSPISESSLQAAGVQSFSLGKLSMQFSPGSASRYGNLKSKEAYDIIASSGYMEMCPLIQ
ncbi:hypothetical protein M0R72_19375 [Candidatus Pacearchaeota archaeon]|jgi:hypothetical protein|nr:hypothetical protein [Candidatus Pacearchaeota archaeon]